MMRYLFILYLVLAVTPAAIAQASDSAEAVSPSASELVALGQLEGHSAAQQVPTSGRFVGGFAAGFGLGLIGTGIVYAIASSTPDVPETQMALIQAQPAAYQAAYQEAYRRDIKSRRQSNALIGGLVGTAAVVTLILSAN
jgi:hypothetical protein